MLTAAATKTTTFVDHHLSLIYNFGQQSLNGAAIWSAKGSQILPHI
jgi:hypothetical protein